MNQKVLAISGNRFSRNQVSGRGIAPRGRSVEEAYPMMEEGEVPGFAHIMAKLVTVLVLGSKNMVSHVIINKKGWSTIPHY